MNRAMRRAMREWKEEFSRNWQRLNTFMRIVLGVMLAMALVWGARRWVLDPLQQQLSILREENSVIDMPDGIIRPEVDIEVQENKLKAESLTVSLADAVKRVKEVAAHDDVVSLASKGEVLTAMAQLISRHHLLLRSHKEKVVDETIDPPAVPVSHHMYCVTGSFQAIRSFLHALNAFGYLSWFDGFELQLMLDEQQRVLRVGGKACLQLNFDCTLYYYEAGQ